MSQNQSILDKSKSVKKGEELNIQQVNNWLRMQLDLPDNLPTVTQYTGGASNWTYCLSYSNLELILRRPPDGTKAKSAHDMVREYKIQDGLKSEFPYVPKMLALCQDESVIGCDFYVMEKLVGIIPRSNFPRGMHLDKALANDLCKNMVDKLIELHKVNYQATGLADLGRGKGYCKRQIDGWSKRYTKAKTWNVPAFTKVIAWLKEHTPEDSTTCIIHNDFRLDNLVLDPDDPRNIIGMLDWELATLGDPLMDLGNTLAQWVQADDNIIMRAMRRSPTNVKGMFSREEFREYYLDKMNLKISNWDFYEVYGLFKLAGIAQQIYYRYHHKQTRNKAFKNFWIMVNYLHFRCNKIIQKSKI